MGQDEGSQKLINRDAAGLCAGIYQSLSLRRHMLAWKRPCGLMPGNTARTKRSGVSSGCSTILITSAGPIRRIIRFKGRPFSRAWLSQDIIYAIKSHADYLTDCPRVSRLDKTLYACDELAGFITACAMVRPERLNGMQPASVKKKLKAKGFAASVNRDDITRGAADLGVDWTSTFSS